MVTVVHTREHLDGYNNIYDISLFMYVDSIDDRQHICIIYPITMIQRKVIWSFRHCIG